MAKWRQLSRHLFKRRPDLGLAGFWLFAGLLVGAVGLFGFVTGFTTKPEYRGAHFGGSMILLLPSIAAVYWGLHKMASAPWGLRVYEQGLGVVWSKAEDQYPWKE